MAGLIKREDVEAVRERARIEEIVSAHVTLKPAGVGSLKGLCPFHDEKSPSFNVRPTHGTFHCFGCGEGGGVIDFVMKIEHVGFVEAVERLADRVGYRLTYTGGGASVQRDRGTGLVARQCTARRPRGLPRHAAPRCGRRGTRPRSALLRRSRLAPGRSATPIA